MSNRVAFPAVGAFRDVAAFKAHSGHALHSARL